jgi:hypothetical protein
VRAGSVQIARAIAGGVEPSVRPPAAWLAARQCPCAINSRSNHVKARDQLAPSAHRASGCCFSYHLCHHIDLHPRPPHYEHDNLSLDYAKCTAHTHTTHTHYRGRKQHAHFSGNSHWLFRILSRRGSIISTLRSSGFSRTRAPRTELESHIDFSPIICREHLRPRRNGGEWVQWERNRYILWRPLTFLVPAACSLCKLWRNILNKWISDSLFKYTDYLRVNN